MKVAQHRFFKTGQGSGMPPREARLLRCMKALVRQLSIPLLILALVGCDDSAPDEIDGGGPLAPREEMRPTLASRDELLAGAPHKDSLVTIGKEKSDYPTRFDLADSQSPVRNQGQRPLGAVFAVVGLMEHLYLLENSLPEPSFSAQFLQWSTKVELAASPDSEAASAALAVETIHRHGLVLEEFWPYVPAPWGRDEAPECFAEPVPLICRTLGEPPESALQAPRHSLPRGRFISSAPRSIKAYMRDRGAAVVATVDFFFQAWNHADSELPVSRINFSEGYVPYPNNADIERSSRRRAGHSVLLVGWDDELEVPVRDERGRLMRDHEGELITERGFFLFKNSWGTEGFGIRNEFGPGYGWISQRYLEEFALILTVEQPDFEAVEDCLDGLDNTGNGLTDCDDPDCSEHRVCRRRGSVVTSRRARAIPELGPMGETTVDVHESGYVADLFVTMNIQHSDISDLVVSLVAPGGQRAMIHDRAGRSGDPFPAVHRVEGLRGVRTKGPWQIEVADMAPCDSGKLTRWSLEIINDDKWLSELCDYEDPDCATPDCAEHPLCRGGRRVRMESDGESPFGADDPAALVSRLEFDEIGSIANLRIGIHLTHPYRGDLRLSLIAPTGNPLNLFEHDAQCYPNVVAEFDLPEFAGFPLDGAWMLQVDNPGKFAAGTLHSWFLEATLEP